MDMLEAFRGRHQETMLGKQSKFHACNLSEIERLLRDFDVSILQK